MNTQLLVGFLMTLAPISELRGGLPVIVEYCTKKGLSVWPYFAVVLALNILVIVLIFLFMDFFHSTFLRFGFYRRFSERVLNKIRIKAQRIEGKMDSWGYLALMLFVSIPLPGTGAWTGTLVAWTLGLKRFNSFVAISLGVVLAGFLILFASLGFFVTVS